MNRNLNYLFVITAAGVLWTGCCAEKYARKWEYKVASPAGGEQNLGKVIEPFLNNMAKDGWIFIERDDIGHFYFKRIAR